MTPTSDVGDGVAVPRLDHRRIGLLDALRGFALAGVLLVNLRDFSLYGLLDDAQRGALPTADWDAWLDALIDGFVAGKAITLFALLFGVGFVLQLQRVDAHGRGRRRFARRLLILLGFGVLHAALFWWGDILRYYAVLGFVLLLCARWPARRLWIAGFVVSLLATSMAQPLMTGWPRLFGDGNAILARALTAFSGHAWVTMWRANAAYDVYVHGTAWSLVFFTLGRLLLGAGIGRSGWLSDASFYRRQWRGLFWSCLPIGWLLTGHLLLRDHDVLTGPLLGLQGMQERTLSRFMRSAAYVLTGLGYLSAFVLLYLRPAWKRRLDIFAPAGRMALSNYVSQTVIGVLLFYGVGLGLGPRFGLPGVVLAFVAIFACQLLVSRYWLAHFRFGPLEWLWRCLTDGHRPHNVPEPSAC